MAHKTKHQTHHRRTKSSYTYDIPGMLNVSSGDQFTSAYEIVQPHTTTNLERTQKAVEASTKIATEKHIIVEDIEEVPKSTGYIVPRYPKNDSGPLSIIKRRNLSGSMAAKVNSMENQQPKKIDAETVNNLTGLNTIHERQQSIESSDFKSDKMSVSSKETHTRTNSLNDGIFGTQFSNRNQSGKRSHFHQESEQRASPLGSGRSSLNSSPKVTHQIQKNTPTSLFLAEGQSPHADSNSKLNINKKMTPEEAKSFLKLLTKQRLSPSLNTSNNFDSNSPSNVEKPRTNVLNFEEDKFLSKTPQNDPKYEYGRITPKVFIFDDSIQPQSTKGKSKIRSEKPYSATVTPKGANYHYLEHTEEGGALIRELKATIDSLRDQIKIMHQDQRELMKQVTTLTETVASLQKENLSWRKVKEVKQYESVNCSGLVF